MLKVSILNFSAVAVDIFNYFLII